MFVRVFHSGGQYNRDVNVDSLSFIPRICNAFCCLFHCEIGVFILLFRIKALEVDRFTV